MYKRRTGTFVLSVQKYVNLQKENNGNFDSLLLFINKSRRSILNKMNFNNCNDTISGVIAGVDIKYRVMFSIRVCR